ncbi:OsmC family protein [Litorimonas sp. WD9-15]|uniref:OsmC family protein n=1 Tax=Litorimonas sp. WD9-15 TaxID=3418716 RepID=UPI003D0828DA
MAQPVTVKERLGGIYTLDVTNGRHHLYADEPVEYGSSDLGPSPFEYLCASLGSCTAITLRMYVGRKKWEIETIAVTVTHSYRKTADGETKSVFSRVLNIESDLPEEELGRLVEIANKCPVHKMLEHGNIVETTLG